MKKMMIAGVVAIPLITFTFLQQESISVKTITTNETIELTSKDTTIILLDVRTSQEWNGSLGHLQGALLLPLQELGERIHELEPHKDKTIVVYCRSGNRSATATQLLAAKEFKVFNMEGGMIKWNAEQLPVIKEERK